MMSREIAVRCLELIQRSPSIKTVDLTGGAPELCKEFRFIVEEASKLGKEVIDRSVLFQKEQKNKNETVSLDPVLCSQ
jgi:molybdenum cofactor biosynthesis enzyme MoaA